MENAKSPSSFEPSGVETHVKGPILQFSLSPLVKTPKEATGKNLEPAKTKEVKYLTGTKLVMVISAVTLVNFLVSLDITIIVTAIPSITTHFHSLDDIGWYGSAYQITGACVQPLSGRIYTNFSSKWTYLGFFFVFELGSLLCALATSSKMLIIARAVAGIGSAGLTNGTLTIATSSVPLHKSPPLIGAIMGFSQLGAVLGPLLGGAFTEYVTWRWCFYINLPVGAIVALLLVSTEIPDENAKMKDDVFSIIFHKLDLIGFVFFTPAAVQLLLAIEYGTNQYDWSNMTVIGLFCGSGATFIVFIFWEHRQGDLAMIPLPIISRRIVWASCLVIMCNVGITLVASFYLPIYFQAVNNDSPTMSGVCILPAVLAHLIFAVLSGVLIGKLGYYLPWGVFCGVVASIGNGLISTWAPDTPTGKLVGYQILLGAGRGAGYQVPIIAIQNALPPSQVSIAIAILICSQRLFGALCLTFAHVIFSSGLKNLVPKYAPNVNPTTVIKAGAAGIRDVVSSQDLAGVVKAYADSIDRVFYMVAALGVFYLAFCSGMEWKDVRKKTPSAEHV
ncbi:hypothetical protein N7520_007412 [Penicillium odoratum]|uniref:uncharacterized protein n=1 Tax=Penicillium odoratum TaxID=1167516 RepID=UPI002549B941|nr:uncharacterized protein N7520_007412 [Penicillium odoratum]KAJ5760256.1 hypothetical protein N7520_007412 [Penicillium odoratum]